MILYVTYCHKNLKFFIMHYNKFPTYPTLIFDRLSLLSRNTCNLCSLINEAAIQNKWWTPPHVQYTTVPVTLPCSSLSLHCAAPAEANRTCWGWGLVWRDPHDWLTAEGMEQWETAPHCTDVTALAANWAEVGTETVLEDDRLYFHHMGTVNVINWLALLSPTR